MFVKQFPIGGDRNFGYLAVDENTGAAFVVDPSYAPEIITEFAGKKDYEIKYAFCTHDHYDHTSGNNVFKRLTGIAPLLFGEVESSSGIKIGDNTKLPLGNLEVTIMHTPGHTSDCICIYADDAVFTGDTLFVGKVGGTDYGDQAKAEYDSLHNKLMKLPGSTRVFPGHDYGTAPESTIENELRTNPFLLRPNLSSFIDLKINWLEYKREHGIE
ncbi:hydroxyacylglutathione hydrolase family protein [Fibrobacterota bacterium]